MLQELKDEEAKAKFKKNEVKAKIILIDSIKDHLIPNVSELNTAKEMFDSLTKLYEIKNTSGKLTLRHQLINVTMNKSEMIANFFTRISQIKDQLEAIGDPIEDDELVTSTLNGFPPSWGPFVQGICARRKLPKFDKLWEDFSQDESRLMSKKQKVDDEENQALATQVKKRKERKEGSPSKYKKPHRKRDISKVQCFNCRNMGHYSAQFPHKHEKEKKKKHHAHATDVEEQKLKDEEFLFILALTKTITQGSDTWLIDSSASKHMTRFINSLSKLTEKVSSLQVVLGDDSKHAIKGVGEASLQIDLVNPLLIKYILFVQGLKKNILSISALEDKGFRVAFVDGQVLLWPKNSSINKDIVIGFREGGLYKLKGHQEQALVHNSVSSSELWHRRLAHLKYRALPVLRKMVTGLPKIQIDHD
jgi:hypothetical protein